MKATTTNIPVNRMASRLDDNVGQYAGVESNAASGGRELIHGIFSAASEVHPASYPQGTGGCFAEGKAAGALSWPFTSI
jgi:hypothetical protein